MSITDRVEHHARGAARDAAPWVVGLARLGYAARGVVYVIVGVLAARVAMGERARVEGTRGALTEIIEKPFGRVMLGIVALGLFGYALWRLVQAVMDPERKGHDAGGTVKRLGYALSGIVHAGLALTAARMVMGSSGGGGGGTQTWTARLMEAPAGRWLVALVGLGFAGYGIYQFYRAIKSDLAKRLDLGSMRARTREMAIRAARAGVAARGVVFLLIAYFLARAAIDYNPAEARGLQGALQALRDASYGPYLLGAVAVGLIGYGLFEIVKARYRRISAT
ncbi:MAG TPA: DUF1206 domain-containing protein [Longimicrobium sp.]|nr:DUF1206 domain-containing protein [Longimicrobium sp.]